MPVQGPSEQQMSHCQHGEPALSPGCCRIPSGKRAPTSLLSRFPPLPHSFGHTKPELLPSSITGSTSTSPFAEGGSHPHCALGMSGLCCSEQGHRISGASLRFHALLPCMLEHPLFKAIPSALAFLEIKNPSRAGFAAPWGGAAPRLHRRRCHHT